MSPHDSSTSHLGGGAGGADANKRSADEANVDAQNAAKRKRPQSCDTCRSRKIKCVRLHVDGIDVSADNRCVQCRAIDAKCTFDYVPKRPGPQSSFAKTARKEAEAHARHTTSRPPRTASRVRRTRAHPPRATPTHPHPALQVPLPTSPRLPAARPPTTAGTARSHSTTLPRAMPAPAATRPGAPPGAAPPTLTPTSTAPCSP